MRSGANAALRMAVEIGGGLISIVSSSPWWMRQVLAARAYGGPAWLGEWVALLLCGAQYPGRTSCRGLLGAGGGCSADEGEGLEGNH